MIQIEEQPWREMRAHAESEYPNECCGVMLGSLASVNALSETNDEVKLVRQSAALANVAQQSHRARYELAPEDLIRADREARARGMDLIGIYHSHPDCDAYFSETDLKNSCPWYSFVVLSVKDGKFDHANSFLPNADQTLAEKEEMTCPKF